MIEENLKKADNSQDNQALVGQVDAVVMRDLSTMLWSDLESDDERIAFLESGRACDTGIIAPVMVAEVVKALKCRIAIENCIDWANNRETEWGSRAEGAFKFLYDALDA